VRLLLVLVVLSALTAGCMCGPHVGSVEAAANLDASFDGNKTAYRQALEGAGFTVDEEYYGTLHGVKGNDAVWVRSNYDEANTTGVLMTFYVPSREFSDDPDGSDEARRYIAEEAAKAQPRAEAYAELLRQAVGAPPGAPPKVDGTYDIC
jgi:hypothetical protein